MYLLLPQLVARDQAGVGEAVAAHFATAHAWATAVRERVSGAGSSSARLKRRVFQIFKPACCYGAVFWGLTALRPMLLHMQTCLEPSGGSPTCHNASDVFRRSQALWGSQPGGAPALRSSRSFAALEKLERPTVQVAESLPREPRPAGWLARTAGGLHRALSAVERASGFSRNQLALGMQVRLSGSGDGRRACPGQRCLAQPALLPASCTSLRRLRWPISVAHLCACGTPQASVSRDVSPTTADGSLLCGRHVPGHRARGQRGPGPSRRVGGEPRRAMLSHAEPCGATLPCHQMRCACHACACPAPTRQVFIIVVVHEPLLGSVIWK